MFHSLSENPVKPKTPISAYNLVIKQYNDPINIQSNVVLSKAYNNLLYKFWYRLQVNHYFLLFLMYLIPYVNFVTFICNLHLIVLNELAILKMSKNKEKVLDPLLNMIYEPDLCNRNHTPYLYYEIDVNDISIFSFNRHTEEKILRLKENADGKIIRFMAYNQKFIAGYYATVEYRMSSYIHLLVNSGIIFFVFYFIYSNWVCFSLLSPFDYKKCVIRQLDLTP